MSDQPVRRRRTKTLDTSNIKNIIEIRPVNTYSHYELECLLELCERTYRAGFPIMSDDTYDLVYYKEFKRRFPDHPMFDKVGSDLN